MRLGPPLTTGSLRPMARTPSSLGSLLPGALFARDFEIVRPSAPAGWAPPRGLAVDSSRRMVDEATAINYSDSTVVNAFDAKDGKLMRLAK